MILPAGSSESYYDLFEDWDLIVSSVPEQYGIRIYSAEFPIILLQRILIQEAQVQEAERER